MKTVVAYYSLTGTCKKLAEARAKALGAPAIAVEDARKRNFLSGVFDRRFPGPRAEAVCRQAISDKITGCDGSSCRVGLAACPRPRSTASYPRCAGAGGRGQLGLRRGKSRAEAKVRAQLEAKGVKLLSFTDVKAPAKVKEPKK